jgi:hypothetical protein
MSLIFTHHDNRTDSCDHDGMLGRAAADGTRMCVRCGETVKPERDSFTEPARRERGRRATTTMVG